MDMDDGNQTLDLCKCSKCSSPRNQLPSSPGGWSCSLPKGLIGLFLFHILEYLTQKYILPLKLNRGHELEESKEGCIGKLKGKYTYILYISIHIVKYIVYISKIREIIINKQNRTI